MITFYDVIRMCIYMWASVEAYLLFHLYSYGFSNFKKSKVIASLSALLFFIGVYYSFVFLMAVTRSVNTSFYIEISQYAYLLAFLVAICLKWFREESLRKPKK